jgi:hypothetical protein
MSTAQPKAQTITVEETMSIKEAAFILHVSCTKVRDLRKQIDPLTGKPFLASREIKPWYIVIESASVLAYSEAVKNPKFWRLRKACTSPAKLLQRQSNRAEKPTRQLLPGAAITP